MHKMSSKKSIQSPNHLPHLTWVVIWSVISVGATSRSRQPEQLLCSEQHQRSQLAEQSPLNTLSPRARRKQLEFPPLRRIASNGVECRAFEGRFKGAPPPKNTCQAPFRLGRRVSGGLGPPYDTLRA